MPSSGQDAVSQRGTGFPRPPFSCPCDRTEAPLAAFPVPAVNSPGLFLSLLQAPHGGGSVPAEIPSPALFAKRAKQGSAVIRHGSLRRITSYVPSTTLARISGGRKCPNVWTKCKTRNKQIRYKFDFDKKARCSQ